jgi:hypothetical protein
MIKVEQQSPLERKFWESFCRHIKGIDLKGGSPEKEWVWPWEKSQPTAEKLQELVIKGAREKFAFLRDLAVEDSRYDEHLVKRYLSKSKHYKSINPKKSLEYTYRAWIAFLSKESLDQSELQMLREVLGLWDKNSAWWGNGDEEPLSTFRNVAWILWIYLHGLGNKPGAVAATSTLAFGLMRLGFWSDAKKCLEWAIQWDDKNGNCLEKTARRGLLEALAMLHARLDDHQKALELYDQCAVLGEHSTYHKGKIALSRLSLGGTEAETDLEQACQKLKEDGNTRFGPMLLGDVTEYYVQQKRFVEASQVVGEGFKLLERDTEPERLRNQRKRFLNLKEFLEAQNRLDEILSHKRAPLYELIKGAEAALQDSNRVCGLLLLVAGLETITLAMWLGKRDLIDNNKEMLWTEIVRRRKTNIKKPRELMKFFPKSRQWQRFETALPNLRLKNIVLSTLGAYDQNETKNNEISDWIDEVRIARNNLIHGHVDSERVRFPIYRLDYLHRWYAYTRHLLRVADDDIDNYYRSNWL